MHLSVTSFIMQSKSYLSTMCIRWRCTTWWRQTTFGSRQKKIISRIRSGRKTTWWCTNKILWTWHQVLTKVSLCFVVWFSLGICFSQSSSFFSINYTYVVLAARAACSRHTRISWRHVLKMRKFQWMKNMKLEYLPKRKYRIISGQ